MVWSVNQISKTHIVHLNNKPYTATKEMDVYLHRLK